MKIADLARANEVWQFHEGCGENLFMLLAVSRTAKSTTHRMIDEECARRRDFDQDVQDGADHQCRDRMAFDDMGDETDGLMAEGSVWDEQCQVNAGLPQLSSNRRGEFDLDLLMAPDAALKRNVKRRHASDDLPGSEIC